MSENSTTEGGANTADTVIHSKTGVSRSGLKSLYEKQNTVPLPPTLRELVFSGGQKFLYVSSKDVGFVSGALSVRNISVDPEKVSDSAEGALERDSYQGVYDRYLLSIDGTQISIELRTSQMHYLLSTDSPALSDYLVIPVVKVSST